MSKLGAASCAVVTGGVSSSIIYGIYSLIENQIRGKEEGLPSYNGKTDMLVGYEVAFLVLLLVMCVFCASQCILSQCREDRSERSSNAYRIAESERGETRAEPSTSEESRDEARSFAAGNRASFSYSSTSGGGQTGADSLGSALNTACVIGALASF